MAQWLAEMQLDNDPFLLFQFFCNFAGTVSLDSIILTGIFLFNSENSFVSDQDLPMPSVCVS